MRNPILKLSLSHSKLSTIIAFVVIIFSLHFAECEHISHTKNNNTSLYTHQEQKYTNRLLHSYHNIIIRNVDNNTSSGILPYFGLHRNVFHLDGETLVPLNECTVPSAIEDFPGTIFPEEALRKGAVIFHVLAAIYFLSVLAIVCGHYFLPSVECICEDLNLSSDVAAATFMATATTMPEFFTNTISTFVTDSDLGIGAIIGSMLFNTLGVVGCASLASAKPIQVDWWPLTRDALLFSIHISLLVIFALDGNIWWYNATVFVCLYILYFVIMFQNKRISKFFRKYVEGKWKCCTNKVFDTDQVTQVTIVNDTIQTIETPPNNENSKDKENNNIIVEKQMQISKHNGHLNSGYVGSVDNILTPPPTYNDAIHRPSYRHSAILAPHILEDEEEEIMSLWKVSRNSKWAVFWWFYTWPIRLVCTCIIPNPRTFRSLYPLTFIMCMLVLALNSYMVVWMVTVIGFTFQIPEAVMGLTFLAAGGCLPEAASAIIMARKGDGALGISNSLGSNSLAVLFSLGFPWFFRTMVDMAKGEPGVITIYNNGIEFTILILLLAVLSLYIIITCSKFKLKRLVGASLLCVYTMFVTIGILMNMGLLGSFAGGTSC